MGGVLYTIVIYYILDDPLLIVLGYGASTIWDMERWWMRSMHGKKVGLGPARTYDGIDWHGPHLSPPANGQLATALEWIWMVYFDDAAMHGPALFLPSYSFHSIPWHQSI